MNLFGMMETSGSAMEAERMRAEVVAANMANAETTRTAQGGPYRRQEVVFAANEGDAGLSRFHERFDQHFMSATKTDSGAGPIGAGEVLPALPPLLPLPGAPNVSAGRAHLRRWSRIHRRRSSATIRAIPTPDRTATSRIPTLILLQKWWT